jgi:hypothetical protein
MMAQTLLRATPTFPLTTRPGQTYAHAAWRTATLVRHCRGSLAWPGLERPFS